MNFIRFSFKQHPILASLVALIMVVMIALGIFFSQGLRDVRGGRGMPEGIEPWMTPQFVGHHWGAPREAMYGVLELDLETPKEDLPRTIGEIAHMNGLTLDEIEERLLEAGFEEPQPKDRND